MKVEKAELWAAISFVLFVICGLLVRDQMVAPALRVFWPAFQPLWVLGAFSALMLMSVFNLIRHAVR